MPNSQEKRTKKLCIHFNRFQMQQNTSHWGKDLSFLLVMFFKSKFSNPTDPCLVPVVLRPRGDTWARAGWHLPPRVRHQLTSISSSRTNIRQPQSARLRAPPDRAATSMDVDLSGRAISADNIAPSPHCREPTQPGAEDHTFCSTNRF